MDRTLICALCDRTFNKSYNLKRHCAEVHNESCEILPYSTRDSNFKCTICKDNCQNFTGLKVHVKQAHGIELIQESISFPNSVSFYEWKNQVEEEGCFSYVKKSAKKILPNDCFACYFYCNRSGFKKVSLDDENRKLKMKTQSSSRIEGFCPSGIRAIFMPDGTVNIDYRKTHMGHIAELLQPDEKDEKLKLFEKRKITSKLKNFRKLHKKSLSMANTLIIYNNETDTWEVSPFSSLNTYTLKLVNDSCDCGIICEDCNACIHKYSCSCHEYSFKCIMCVHIHILCTFLVNVKSNNQPQRAFLDNSSSEICIKVHEPSTSAKANITSEETCDLENESDELTVSRSKVRSRFEEMLQSIKTLDGFRIAEETLKNLQKQLAAAQKSDLNSTLKMKVQPQKAVVPTTQIVCEIIEVPWIEDQAQLQ